MRDRDGFACQRCGFAAVRGGASPDLATRSGRVLVRRASSHFGETHRNGGVTLVRRARGTEKDMAGDATREEGGYMKCEEAAEFASRLCDGQVIPREMAEHIGTCEA